MPFSVETRRSYSGGHFELRIDDVITPAYIKSVEGGFVKMNTTSEPFGIDLHHIKHATTLEVDPITVEVGMAQANMLLWWIACSWRKEYARHNGAVTHADMNYKAQFIHEFYDALIEETSFPTLDASSKDPLLLKVKLRPERIELKNGDRQSIQGEFKGRQKMWTAAAFRLNIEGVDTRFVNKIEGFTVKQGIKPVAPGPYRLPQLEPTKIEFPDLKVHMSLQHAQGVLDWYKEVVLEGKRDTKAEKSGSIEFLSQDRTKTLATIELKNIGIKSFSLPKSEANADSIKRCQFELFVGSMDLGGDVRLMLEP